MTSPSKHPDPSNCKMAPPFKVCLAAVGHPRKIVEVGEDDALSDLFRIAAATFASTFDDPMISLKSGFPPKTMIDSATKARSVLSNNDRVSVILLGDKKKPSRSAAAIPSTNDRPSKKLKLDVNAKTDEKKKASRKSVMQAATMPSTTKDDRPAKRPRLNGIAKTDEKTDANSKSNATSLKVLSWNIAECRPSHDAPAVFTCEQAILREILSHEAHILCLQECPSASWKPGCLQQTYDCVGASESHCGFTQLWIHKNLFYQPLESKGPSVAAVVLVGNQSLGISSSHLAPSKENAPSRLKQVTSLVQCFSATPNFVMAGDFNMRQVEDKAVEGFGLQDVFKVVGCPKTANFTWDSHQNKYHGPDAFSFKCRFDRMYFSTAQQKVSFELVGNQPQVVTHGPKEYKFYLSDHFGMLCTLQLPAAVE